MSFLTTILPQLNFGQINSDELFERMFNSNCKDYIAKYRKRSEFVKKLCHNIVTSWASFINRYWLKQYRAEGIDESFTLIRHGLIKMLLKL